MIKEFKYKAWLIEEEELVDVLTISKCPDEDFERVWLVGYPADRNFRTNGIHCYLKEFVGELDRNGMEVYSGDKIKIYTDQLPYEYKLPKEIIVCEIEWESGGFHAINYELEAQFPLWQIDVNKCELLSR